LFFGFRLHFQEHKGNYGEDHPEERKARDRRSLIDQGTGNFIHVHDRFGIIIGYVSLGNVIERGVEIDLIGVLDEVAPELMGELHGAFGGEDLFRCLES